MAALTREGETVLEAGACCILSGSQHRNSSPSFFQYLSHEFGFCGCRRLQSLQAIVLGSAPTPLYLQRTVEGDEGWGSWKREVLFRMDAEGEADRRAARLDVLSETGVGGGLGPQGAWAGLPLTKVSRTEKGLAGGQQAHHPPPSVSMQGDQA